MKIFDQETKASFARVARSMNLALCLAYAVIAIFIVSQFRPVTIAVVAGAIVGAALGVLTSVIIDVLVRRSIRRRP